MNANTVGFATCILCWLEKGVQMDARRCWCQKWEGRGVLRVRGVFFARLVHTGTDSQWSAPFASEEAASAAISLALKPGWVPVAPWSMGLFRLEA